MSLPNSYHGLVYDDKIKVIKGVEPTGVSSDGKGIILSDGQTLEAEVVIAATGYGYPFDFIRDLNTILRKLIPLTPPSCVYSPTEKEATRPRTRGALLAHKPLRRPRRLPGPSACSRPASI